MNLKHGTISFKSLNAEEGNARVVFATMNVIDRDSDLTEPGAFGNQTAHLLGAHNWGMAPIGVAKISEQGNEAIADLKFYLEMQTGREWYLSLKNSFENGVRTEFSYGYDVLDSEMRTINGKSVRVLKKLAVHEVSPVVLGAGVNTRALLVKNCQSCGVSPGKEGRTLSAENRELLSRFLSALNEVEREVRALLQRTDPGKGKALKQVIRAYGNVLQLIEQLGADAMKAGRVLSRAEREAVRDVIARGQKLLGEHESNFNTQGAAMKAVIDAETTMARLGFAP